jgi:RNA polymerase sigma factor (sigma-70 family)
MPESDSPPATPAEALDRLIRESRVSLTQSVEGRFGGSLRGRATSDDVFQQACVNAHRAIDGFVPDGDLVAAMDRWFRAILRNAAITIVRGRETFVQLASDLSGGVDAGATPSKTAAGKEAWAALASAITSLSATAQTLLRMHYEEGLTHAAIGERLELSAEAVNMRLDRARDKLREILGPSSAFFFVKRRRRPRKPKDDATP